MSGKGDGTIQILHESFGRIYSRYFTWNRIIPQKGFGKKIKMKKDAKPKMVRERIDDVKTKLSVEHFGIFKYGHHYSITIDKNFYNPDTARKEVNRITRLLFNKDRYTPEMLKELSKKPSEIL